MLHPAPTPHQHSPSTHTHTQHSTFPSFPPPTNAQEQDMKIGTRVVFLSVFTKIRNKEATIIYHIITDFYLTTIDAAVKYKREI